MKKLLTLVLTLALLAMACTGLAAEYNLALGHIQAENDSWHLAALAFKEYVEEHSNGRIAVEVYPNSQLGAVPECIETMRTGGVEMAWGSDADIAGFVEEWNLVGLPYLWTSLDAAHEALDGDFGQQLSALAEEKICMDYGRCNGILHFRSRLRRQRRQRIR